MEHYYRAAGIEFVRDFDEVCRRADVYVCDNSSTLFEFASTGRPVVVMNDVSWRRNVHHGLRFWDAAHVGVNVDRADGLVDAVALALEDRAEQRAARSDALDIVYVYRTGAAAGAAAIGAWSREAVAA
jgi:UDP-N-acetylglucosamine:LPS N-acetylglucosamine transferase